MSTTRTSVAVVALAAALALAGCSPTPGSTPTPSTAQTTATPSTGLSTESAPVTVEPPTSTPTPTPQPTDPISGRQRTRIDAGLQVIANTSGATDYAIGGARDDAQQVFDETGQEILLVAPLINPNGTLATWFAAVRGGYTRDEYRAVQKATLAQTQAEAVATAQAWIAAQTDPAIWHIEVAEAPGG